MVRQTKSLGRRLTGSMVYWGDSVGRQDEINGRESVWYDDYTAEWEMGNREWECYGIVWIGRLARCSDSRDGKEVDLFAEWEESLDRLEGSRDSSLGLLNVFGHSELTDDACNN